MVSYHKGNLSGKGVRPAIAASRYNQPIVEKLVEGAVQGFVEHGVKKAGIDVFWVPGAFELPLAARTLATSKKYHCIVCVGCVLKGETYHFGYVCQGVASGIARVSLDTGIPVMFSLLMSDDPQKAWERAGGESGNRGTEGALAALEMVNLLKEIRKRK